VNVIGTDAIRLVFILAIARQACTIRHADAAHVLASFLSLQLLAKTSFDRIEGRLCAMRSAGERALLQCRIVLFSPPFFLFFLFLPCFALPLFPFPFSPAFPFSPPLLLSLIPPSPLPSFPSLSFFPRFPPPFPPSLTLFPSLFSSSPSPSLLSSPLFPPLIFLPPFFPFRLPFYFLFFFLLSFFSLFFCFLLFPSFYPPRPFGLASNSLSDPSEVDRCPGPWTGHALPVGRACGWGFGNHSMRPCEASRALVPISLIGFGRWMGRPNQERARDRTGSGSRRHLGHGRLLSTMPAVRQTAASSGIGRGAMVDLTCPGPVVAPCRHQQDTRDGLAPGPPPALETSARGSPSSSLRMEWCVPLRRVVEQQPHRLVRP